MPASLPAWSWLASGRTVPTSSTTALTVLSDPLTGAATLDPASGGASLTFTPRSGSPTQVFVGGLADFADASGHAAFDILETVAGVATTRFPVHWRPDSGEAPASRHPTPRMYVIPTQASPQAVTLAWRLVSITGAASVAVTDAHVVAAPLNDSDLWSSSDSTTTTPSTSYQQKCSLTLTAGQWLVTLSAQVAVTVGTAPGAWIKGTLAGTDLAELGPARASHVGSLIYQPWCATRLITATGGETAVVWWKAATGNTAGCRHAFITARKVADLPGLFSAETVAEGSPSTSATYADKVNLGVSTNAGRHLLLQTAVARATSTSGTTATGGLKADLDGVDMGAGSLYGWNSAPPVPQPWSHGTASVVTLTQAAHTVRLRWNSSAAALSAYVRDAGLYLIPLTPPPTSTVHSWTTFGATAQTLSDSSSARLSALIPAPRSALERRPATVAPGAWSDADGLPVAWVDADGLPLAWNVRPVRPLVAVAARSRLPFTVDLSSYDTTAVWIDADGDVATWTDADGDVATWTGDFPQPEPGLQPVPTDFLAQVSSSQGLVSPAVVELRTNLAAWIGETARKTGARPVRFFWADFGSRGIFRSWTGFGDRTWNQQIFHGAGEVLQVGAPRESTDRDRNGLTVTLSGFDRLQTVSHLVDAQLADWHGRVAIIYEGFIDDSGNLIDDLVAGFHGELSQMNVNIDESGSATIEVQIEHEASDADRSMRYRITASSQQAIDPDDLGLQYLATLASRKLDWDGLFAKEVHPPNG